MFREKYPVAFEGVFDSRRIFPNENVATFNDYFLFGQAVNQVLQATVCLACINGKSNQIQSLSHHKKERK